MTTIASRDLRNHTRDVLDQVSAGATVTITVHGRPVAEVRPVASSTPTSLSRQEVLGMLRTGHGVDAELLADLAWISGGTTEDLDPIR